jgi:hypothetical protein
MLRQGVSGLYTSHINASHYQSPYCCVCARQTHKTAAKCAASHHQVAKPRLSKTNAVSSSQARIA